MKNSDYFCYSTRLYHFLVSMKFRYMSVRVNKNTNKKYWTFQKSEKLDSAIELYNSFKHRYS